MVNPLKVGLYVAIFMILLLVTISLPVDVTQKTIIAFVLLMVFIAVFVDEALNK
jgi:hypothetical protein